MLYNVSEVVVEAPRNTFSFRQANHPLKSGKKGTWKRVVCIARDKKLRLELNAAFLKGLVQKMYTCVCAKNLIMSCTFFMAKHFL